jgi:hypothetical protein
MNFLIDYVTRLLFGDIINVPLINYFLDSMKLMKYHNVSTVTKKGGLTFAITFTHIQVTEVAAIQPAKYDAGA